MPSSSNPQSLIWRSKSVEVLCKPKLSSSMLDLVYKQEVRTKLHSIGSAATSPLQSKERDSTMSDAWIPSL
jgi:hypothetical protein